jgi:hypothetical protein
MRRPTANAKCFLSALVLLAGWGLVIGRLAVLGTSRAMGKEADSFGIGAAFLVAFLASPVLAFLGLRELRKAPGRYVEGKGAAWASLGHFVFFVAAAALVLALTKMSAGRSAMVPIQIGVFVVLSFAIWMGRRMLRAPAPPRPPPRA